MTDACVVVDECIGLLLIGWDLLLVGGDGFVCSCMVTVGECDAFQCSVEFGSVCFVGKRVHEFVPVVCFLLVYFVVDGGVQ